MPHTPGPWKCTVEPSSPENYEVWDENFNYLQGDLKTREANAALIAAAPELLEACKLAMKSVNWGELGAKANETIEAAIAKAEGDA